MFEYEYYIYNTPDSFRKCRKFHVEIMIIIETQTFLVKKCVEYNII